MGAISLSLMLAIGAAVAAPGPKAGAGRLESYRDWTVGCDNVQRCEAVSLAPESGGAEPMVLFRIEREAGADADAVVWIQTDDAKLAGLASLLVDERRIADARLNNGKASVRGVQAAALTVAMARGSKLELRLASKTFNGPSLSGSAAALRYMDAQQGRAGTTTALVATGALGAQAVRAAPPLPVVRGQMPPAGLRPAELWAEERARAVRVAGCSEEYVPGQAIATYPLSRSQALLLIPCGAGAYNFLSMPLIATGATGRRGFVKARFDYAPGFGNGDGGATLVNAGWDVTTGRLTSYAKGRGLGDCGNSEEYVWDGSIFRLVEAAVMGECRGVTDWITVWRARAVF